MAQTELQHLSKRGQYWLKHVEQWRQCESTQTQYCKTHKISADAFSWWKRKLFREGYFLDTENQSNNRAVKPAVFTEVNIPLVNNNQSHKEIDIKLPNQVQMTLYQDYNPDKLCQLINIMVKAC